MCKAIRNHAVHPRLVGNRHPGIGDGEQCPMALHYHEFVRLIVYDHHGVIAHASRDAAIYNHIYPATPNGADDYGHSEA
jgi:hypothetical protein